MRGDGRAGREPRPTAVPPASDIAGYTDVGPTPFRRGILGLLLGAALGALAVAAVPRRHLPPGQ